MRDADRWVRWGRLRAALEGARAQIAIATEHSGLLSANDELWLKDIDQQIQSIERNADREEDRVLRDTSESKQP